MSETPSSVNNLQRLNWLKIIGITERVVLALLSTMAYQVSASDKYMSSQRLDIYYINYYVYLIYGQVHQPWERDL